MSLVHTYKTPSLSFIANKRSSKPGTAQHSATDKVQILGIFLRTCGPSSFAMCTSPHIQTSHKKSNHILTALWSYILVIQCIYLVLCSRIFKYTDYQIVKFNWTAVFIVLGSFTQQMFSLVPYKGPNTAELLLIFRHICKTAKK